MKTVKTFILFAICSLFGCLTKAYDGKYILVNKSSETISKIEVTIAGQTKTYENLKPSEQRADSYKVKADDHFRIAGELQSGKKIQSEDGYITNGMDFEHEISITDGGIEVKQLKAQ